MLDLYMEIQRLEGYMRIKQIPEEEIRIISSKARAELELEITSLLDKYKEEAKEIGDAKGLDNFVEQVTEIQIGSGFNIGTTSGKTDFTVPPFPMLPKLLKNAKVAKDGTLYKKIPMKQKTKVSSINAMKKMNSNLKRGSRNKASKKDERYSGGAPTDFRMATSKQDASTKWIHPGKEGNMGPVLADMNARLEAEIDNIIQQVIDKYRD